MAASTAHPTRVSSKSRDKKWKHAKPTEIVSSPHSLSQSVVKKLHFFNHKQYGDLANDLEKKRCQLITFSIWAVNNNSLNFKNDSSQKWSKLMINDFLIWPMWPNSSTLRRGWLHFQFFNVFFFPLYFSLGDGRDLFRVKSAALLRSIWMNEWM